MRNVKIFERHYLTRSLAVTRKSIGGDTILKCDHSNESFQVIPFQLVFSLLVKHVQGNRASERSFPLTSEPLCTFKVQLTPQFFPKHILQIALPICAETFLRLIKTSRFYGLLKL